VNYRLSDNSRKAVYRRRGVCVANTASVPQFPFLCGSIELATRTDYNAVVLLYYPNVWTQGLGYEYLTAIARLDFVHS
jgi:hypothetical protein